MKSGWICAPDPKQWQESECPLILRLTISCWMLTALYIPHLVYNHTKQWQCWLLSTIFIVIQKSRNKYKTVCKCYTILRLGSLCAVDCTLQAQFYTINRVLMKLVKTSDIEVIEECTVDVFFNVELPSVQLQKRFQNFCNSSNKRIIYLHAV